MTNMYPWVDETRNPLAGECKHNCDYCFMKSYPFNRTKKYTGEPRIDKKELNKIKGIGKTIFVCSATDLFGQWVPDHLIKEILEHCKRFDNTYLFQSKNPFRFIQFESLFPPKTILGTTLETNRDYEKTWALPPEERKGCMKLLKVGDKTFDIMISVEPIMDFDLPIFTTWFYQLRPKFVSIGADSKRSNLPEPSPEKLKLFINELEKITEVRVKSNLKRLLKR